MFLVSQNLGAKKEIVTETETPITLAKAQPKPSPVEAPKLSEAKIETTEKPVEVESKSDADKLFNDAKPLLKRLTAGFEPQRQEMVERLAEQQIKRMMALANLNPEQQAALKQHLLDFSEKEKGKWQAMLDGKGDMEDMMKMGRGAANSQKMLDEWAKANLEGEQAKSYETGRLGEKAKSITDNANAQIDRMNKSLGLDETQKDEMFQILVRSDKDFDPSMQLEGVTGGSGVPNPLSRDEAIAAILNPEQKEKYQSQQQERAKRFEGFRRALGQPESAQGQ